MQGLLRNCSRPPTATAAISMMSAIPVSSWAVKMIGFVVFSSIAWNWCRSETAPGTSDTRPKLIKKSMLGRESQIKAAFSTSSLVDSRLSPVKESRI